MTTTVFCTIADMKVIHIGARIKELREGLELKTNQSDLARSLGVTPQAVQKWEDEKAAPRRNKVSDIAKALNTSVRDLVRGTDWEEFADSTTQKVVSGSRVAPLERPRSVAPRDKRGLVPHISWEQAAEWGQKVTTQNADAEDWLKCPFDHGTEAFVLEIAGESNYDPGGPKSYAPGELIYVDPSRAPANRSMVVVRLDREERATLKQLLMDEGGTRLLRSLNPNWPNRVIPMPEGARMVGVVIGKWVSE